MKFSLKEKISELKTYGDKPIGVFGARASGKTVFFTSLYAMETMNQNKNDIKITCNDMETKEYLRNNYRYIMKGQFPPRTDANTIHKINMTYFFNNQKYNLRSIDFAGELLLGIPDEYKNDDNISNYILKKQQLVFDFFSNCGGILIFLDPNNDTETSLQRESEISKLLVSLQNSSQNWRMLPIAIVITKWDLFNSNLDNADASKETALALEYIQSHKIYNRIYNNVNLFSKKVEVFPISSSGNNLDESSRIIKLNNPFNIFSPLTWIAEYRNKIWFEKITDIKNQNIKISDFKEIIEHFKTHNNKKESVIELENYLKSKIKKSKIKKLILSFFIIIFIISIIFYFFN